jgi:NitT/TauT family transport system ATP-binding protein
MGIEINNIKKIYSDLEVFRDFSLSLPERKISCILGPSGCGKTTLLNMIGGITTQDKGTIDFSNQQIISYIFQEPRLLPWKTVRENIEFVVKDLYNKDPLKNIDQYIKMVGLDAFKDYYPSALSGGMKQRVSIARAFIYPSDIILMDEPLKTLDPRLKLNLMKIFLRIWQYDKRTVVFVTHDVDEALILGEKIFIFSNPPVKLKENITNTLSYEEKTPENANFFNFKNQILNLLE